MNHKKIKNGNSQKKRNGIFRKWHRRIGFVASLFLLNLAVTGILLNHYEALGFHQRFIESGWILSQYGIAAPEEVRCLAAKSANVCQIDRLYYVNQEFWKELPGQLLAAQDTSQGLTIVTNDALFTLTSEIALIEEIPFDETLGDKVVRAQLTLNNLIAESSGGVFSLDLSLMEWQTANSLQDVEISEQSVFQLSPSQLEQLRSDYRTRQVTELQFIQDLHSGGIFGLSGKVTNDISAILLILLAISGFITWRSRTRK